MNLSPSDIENSTRKSGFNHVRKVGGQPSRGGRSVYFQAEHGRKTETRWCGPARETALAAAHDYCAFINADPGRLSAALKRVGKGRVPRDPIDDHEVQAALGVLRDHRAQRRKTAQGYVYCISDGEALKIGYSVKPAARVSELQTGNPRELRLLGYKAGTEAYEALLHNTFIQDNILLEWFRPSEALLSQFGLTFQSDSRLRKEAT